MRSLVIPILALLVGFASGCSEEDAGEAATTIAEDSASASEDSLSGGEDTGEEVEEEPAFETQGPCLTSDDCDSGWCDKTKGGCVDCFLEAHCKDDEVCFEGVCEPKQSCEGGTPCASGVCKSNLQCGDCQIDTDCSDGLVCENYVCGPKDKPCTSDEECQDNGQICGGSGSCVDCNNDTQCGDGEYCNDGTCYPTPCNPGEAACLGNAIQICRADGTGYYLLPCEGDLSCLNGQCLETQCTPGEVECLQHQVKECTASGQIVIKKCPPNQECISGACTHAPARSGHLRHIGFHERHCGEKRVAQLLLRGRNRRVPPTLARL